jgi:CubicO group peptidase (beta-lactamase class C family)
LDLQPETVLGRAVRPFVDSNTLPGAVMLVASKDKLLGLEAVGWADFAGRKPMATDALFWIASQSKPTTAAAFMILVDEGKVSLDDPVEKHLPEFKGQMLAVERDAEHVLLRKPVWRKHQLRTRGIRCRIGATATQCQPAACSPWPGTRPSSAG